MWPRDSSPLALFGPLDPLIILAPFLISMVVVGPLLLYPIARWKAHRAPVPDQQLGIKVALSYFGVIGFQLALLGVLIILSTVLGKQSSDDKSESFRTGFGLLVPGVIVLAAHLSLLRRTNDAQFPTVRRLFLGYNLIVTGLLGLFALVYAFEALFAKGSSFNGRFAMAALLVYTGAWVGCGVHFGRLVLGGYSDPPPPEIVTPVASPPGPPPPAGPSLPSLGGGSFPPIDPT